MVETLNALGYLTTDSGDGETHDFECDRDVGYVVVKLRDTADMVEESHRIYNELRQRGVQFGPDKALIQASYSPLDGYKLIDIHNIHDRDLGDD